MRASVMPRLDCRIKTLEFDPGVLARKLLVDFRVSVIQALVPFVIDPGNLF